MKLKLDINISDKLFFISTLLLSTFPLQTFQLRSISLILWTLLGLLCAYKVQTSHAIRFPAGSRNELFILVLPYLFLSISLFYSLDIDYGLKRLVKLLPMLILPIVFYLNSEIFNAKRINSICWIFSASVIIFVIYLMLRSLLNLELLLSDLSLEELKSNNLDKVSNLDPEVVNKLKNRRFRNFILDLSNSHFTYQGMWIAFSIFFIGKELFRHFNRRKIWGYILGGFIGLLLLWMFMISSRMPIMVMLLASFLTLLSFRIIKTKILIISLIITFSLFASGYLLITPIKVRVNEMLNYKLELPTNGEDIENYNSLNVRNGIYYCSYHTIKENLLFGVGVGDVQWVLNNCYQDKIGAKIYTWKNYNTHNQYLYFWLSSGVLGLLSFVLLLCQNFRSAYLSQNTLFLFFTLIIGLICLTENILSRSDGVTFFALFSSLFLFNLRSEHDHS